MNATVKKWHGQTSTCNVCEQELRQYDTFYDARLKRGPWALMCRACWQRHGLGVGLGVGQEYDSKTLEKIRG